MTQMNWLGGRDGRIVLSLALMLLPVAAAAAPSEPIPMVLAASSAESQAPAPDTRAGTEVEQPTPPYPVKIANPETDSLPVYSPPRRATPRAMTSGGLRIPGSLPLPLALVPAHVAFTRSSAPSLFWWIGSALPADATVVLTVTTDIEPEPLAEITLPLPKQAGVQRVRLSDHGVELAPGVEYEWSIALAKAGTGHASDLIATGYITRVETTEATAAAPVGVRELAAAGLWYDALSAASDEIEVRPADPRPRAARDALLEQAGLTVARD
jgi:hypothetical protein